MKRLDVYLKESLINEGFAEIGAAALVLVAAFCVPNSLSALYQLCKHGLHKIKTNDLAEKLPELASVEKRELIEIFKKRRPEDFERFIKKLDSTTNFEEIIDCIDEFSRNVLTRWNMPNEDREKCKKIYDENSKAKDLKDSRKLKLHWLVSPLEFVEMCLSGIGAGGRWSGDSTSGNGWGGGSTSGGGAGGKW